MVNFSLFEHFSCSLCEDFGLVEVLAEPAFGLASEQREPKTEWRVCECQKGEGPAQERGRP
jgi:hypothetical protein